MRALTLVLVVVAVGACAPARVVVVAPIPPASQIEYRCDPWPIPPGGKLEPALATRFLNEMGAQGWDSFIGNEQVVCFKRYVVPKPHASRDQAGKLFCVAAGSCGRCKPVAQRMMAS